MKLEDLTKHFPSGVAVPPLLVRLLEYQNQWEAAHHDDLRNYLDFGLCDCGDALRRWFGHDEYDADLASRFIIFGHSSTGSLFGYWLYEGQTVETGPIIVLDSEGMEYSGLVADSLDEFLALRALADEDTFNPPGDEEPNTVLAEFRRWVEEECGITVRDSVDELGEGKHHPALAEWLNSKREPHRKQEPQGWPFLV
jgi:hypothetical protein